MPSLRADLRGEDSRGNALNNVLEFDTKANECKEMPPLPTAITTSLNKNGNRSSEIK